MEVGVDLEDILNSRLDIVALHKKQVPHLHSALTKLLVEELCLDFICEVAGGKAMRQRIVKMKT